MADVVFPSSVSLKHRRDAISGEHLACPESVSEVSRELGVEGVGVTKQVLTKQVFHFVNSFTSPKAKIGRERDSVPAAVKDSGMLISSLAEAAERQTS